MPLLPRTVRAVLAALLLATGISPAQTVVGMRLIRSDQVSSQRVFIPNPSAESRAFTLKVMEDDNFDWAVFYLIDGKDDVSPDILSARGVTTTIPPAPAVLDLQILFFPAVPEQGAVKTITLTATPVDGGSPPHVTTHSCRLLDAIIVNDPRDLDDPDSDDLSLDVDPAPPGEQITLRAAIALANLRPGLDHIHFNIPSPGLPRILPATPLPEITNPVVIDGSTQPGAALVGVELSGEALPAAQTSDGLVISGGGSTVRGLAVTRFRSADFGTIPNPAAPNPSGILLKTRGGNAIESCHLGIDPAGTTGAGNEGYGLRIESAGNTVTSCIVSGNWIGGIGLLGPGASDNLITASVGGDRTRTRSSNFLAPPLLVGDLPVDRLDAAPDFATLDANLANASVHYATLHESTPWESPAAGFLGGIVLHQAPRNTITGCNVQGNGADGVRLIGNCDGTELASCVIGPPPGASPTLANAGHGIALTGDNVRVQRCTTSGNSKSGALVRGENNLIKGLLSSRNAESGLRCEGRNTTIGGPAIVDRCQLFSNAGAGLLLTDPPLAVPFLPGNNSILENLIGIESPFASGLLNVRPNLRGVHIDGSGLNSVTNALIAFNRLEGILVTNSRRNHFVRNLVTRNGRLDVDLSGNEHDDGDGPDLPDPGDLDSGGNDKTNAPTILEVVQLPSGASIIASFEAAAPGNHLLEMFFFTPGLSLAIAQSSYPRFITATAGAQPLIVTLPKVLGMAGSYFRAAITDPAGNTSEFSPWIRVEGATHTDSDGLSDEVEALVPTPHSDPPATGDGNGDGDPDAEQDHVVSLPLPDGAFLTLAAPAGQPLAGVAATFTPLAHPRSSLSFPHGTWRFQTTGLAAGSATVTIFLTGGPPASTYHNFGPTPANPQPHWYEFLYDGSTGAEILPDRLVLHFIDGQRGDHDLSADGLIITDGGPANRLPAIPDPTFQTLADGSVLISWDDPAADLFLQQTTAPQADSWHFTTAPVFPLDSAAAVRLRPTPATRLFRLTRP